MKRAIYSSADWVLVSSLFGGSFLYCFIGLIQGGFFLPHWRCYYPPCHDVYISGIAAWSVVGSIMLFWCAVSIRMGLFPLLIGSKARLALEVVLIFCGLALLGLSVHLPKWTPAV